MSIPGRVYGWNFSLDYRKEGTGWPHPWRARTLPTKAERQEYRLTVYGATAQEAIDRLSAAVGDLDADFRLRWRRRTRAEVKA